MTVKNVSLVEKQQHNTTKTWSFYAPCSNWNLT